MNLANNKFENQYKYDVFGNPTLTVVQYGNAIRYAGEFLSKWGEESNTLSLNLYTYGHNNPIMYVDPSGHDIVDDLVSIGVSIIADAIIDSFFGDASGSGNDFSDTINYSTDYNTANPSGSNSEHTSSENSHSSGDGGGSGDSNSNREVDFKDNGDSSKLNDPTTTEQTPDKAEKQSLSEGLPMKTTDVDAYVMPKEDKLVKILSASPSVPKRSANTPTIISTPRLEQKPNVVQQPIVQQGPTILPVEGNAVVTVKYDGNDVSVYRGDNDFTFKPSEVKIDKETGMVKTTHGVSLNTNPDTVGKFGGAYRIDELPSGLKIEQRGIFLNLYISRGTYTDSFTYTE